METIRFRMATTLDAAAIGALHVASWRETYPGLLPDEMLAGLSVETRVAKWRTILGDPAAHAGTRVHVAEADGHILGFVSCGLQRDEALANQGLDGEFSAIYVRHCHQGQGIGRQLMKDMAQTLEARGRKGASLWVLRDNAPARRFYERLGGVVVGEKKDERPGAVLIEVAYGWPDLRPLLPA
jgi:ribosomal protein S18 acetylase RimI-like enzyme